VAAGLVIFVLAASEFGVPGVLRVRVYTTEIFTAFAALYDPGRAARLALPLLALCLAVAGAAVALLLEVADTSVHESREAQGAFGLPVLASIPKVKLEWDRARERRRQILAIGLGVGLAAVTLVGAGAGYWIVNGPDRRAPEAGAPAGAGRPPGAGAPAAGGAPQPAQPQG